MLLSQVTIRTIGRGSSANTFSLGVAPIRSGVEDLEPQPQPVVELVLPPIHQLPRHHDQAPRVVEQPWRTRIQRMACAGALASAFPLIRLVCSIR